MLDRCRVAHPLIACPSPEGPVPRSPLWCPRRPRPKRLRPNPITLPSDRPPAALPVRVRRRYASGRVGDADVRRRRGSPGRPGRAARRPDIRRASGWQPGERGAGAGSPRCSGDVEHAAGPGCLRAHGHLALGSRRRHRGPGPRPARQHQPGEGDEDVARRWLSMGPGLVVVTRAGEGVYTVSRNLEVRRPAVPVDLVDTVGAGDSFTSGLLDGLRRADLVGGARRDALAAVDESTLVSVLDRAALVAAITCSRPGADPPTRAEVDAELAIQRS